MVDAAAPVSPKLPTHDTPAPVETEHANPKKRSREDDDEPSEVDATKDNDTPVADLDPDQPKLSKNQLRKQKRQKLREERKDDRKRQRKEKRHDRTARRRLEREEKAAELAEAMGIDKEEALKKIVAEEQQQAKKNGQKARPVPVAIIIDCEFEQYMRENELISLASQITRGYSMNKMGLYQSHLLVSSWGGKLRERFETVMKSTHKNWKGVSFVEKDFIEAGKEAWGIMRGPQGGKLCAALGGPEEEEADTPEGEAPVKTSEAQEPASENKPDEPVFTTDSIVYLSADSPHVLDKLEPNTSYVIGGLVDRNREKHLCQRRAEQKGIRTAKLPIGEYMQMASRQVLATNHVVEIMAKWLETGDWGKAFMEVIPKRKGGRLKGEEDEKDGEEEGNADAENEDANVELVDEKQDAAEAEA